MFIHSQSLCYEVPYIGHLDTKRGDVDGFFRQHYISINRERTLTLKINLIRRSRIGLENSGKSLVFFIELSNYLRIFSWIINFDYRSSYPSKRKTF